MTPLNATFLSSLIGRCSQRVPFSTLYSIHTIGVVDVQNVSIQTVHEEALCRYIWELKNLLSDTVLFEIDLRRNPNFAVKGEVYAYRVLYQAVLSVSWRADVFISMTRHRTENDYRS